MHVSAHIKGGPARRGLVGRGETSYHSGMSEAEFYSEGTLVAVLTTEPIDRLLDYKAPEGGCVRGVYVEVPLGPRKVLGCVWGPGAGGV